MECLYIGKYIYSKLKKGANSENENFLIYNNRDYMEILYLF